MTHPVQTNQATTDLQNDTHDLIRRVCTALSQANHPNPEYWVTRINQDAIIHADPSIRRFLINQYWRLQLGRVDLHLDINTLSERMCLIEEGTLDNWIEKFRLKVAPCIVQHYEFLSGFDQN